MKKDELKSLIRSGIKKNDTMPLADLAKIKSVAKVRLDIDMESNEYYYCIALDDLVNKEFDYKVLTDNGWELSLDEEKIILYI